MDRFQTGIFMFFIFLSWVTIGIGRYIYLLDKKDI